MTALVLALLAQTMTDNPRTNPRHYLWLAIGVGSVIAPFVVDDVYFPFAVFMAVLGAPLGFAAAKAVFGGDAPRPE